MKVARQIEFIDEVFAGLEKQKNKEDADGKTRQIESGRYTSLTRLEREKSILFKNFPIVVGAAASLANPGDYFLHDLSEVPILIIKGSDGKIRAFLNICRHRGVRLLEESNGHIKRNIVCPYHAWSYDTNGCLKGVFHPQGFDGVSADTHSLIELECHVRLGLIFVVPNPDFKGKLDIDVWLKEVYQVTEGFDLGEMVPYDLRTGKLECNWKLLVDGGLEGYHFKIAHAQTIGPYFLDNVSINQSNQLHSSIVYPKRAMKKLADIPRSEWRIRKYANILVHIFPNTIILIEPDHLMVINNFPLDEKTTVSSSFMLLPSKPNSDQERAHWDLNAEIFWNAINEDNEMAVLQQKSFNAHPKTTMIIGSYEKLIGQFEDLTDRALEGELTATI